MRLAQAAFAIVVLSLSAMAAEKPVTVNKDWEDSCGGNNIEVTTVQGKIVTVDAEAEHFAEQVDDQIEVFHFPRHRIAGLDPSRAKDLKEVLTIAANKERK